MIAVLGVSLVALLGAVVLTAGTPDDAPVARPAPPTRPVFDGGPVPSADLTRDDVELVDPASDLYALAAAAPAGPRGTAVAAQRVLPTPEGIGAAYRVLYRSTSLQGAPIVVSGVVYLPTGRPPTEGWPIISWARGTSGTADRCAPSHGVGGDLVPITLAQQGFVATATDYEGLGTPGLHPYLVGGSEGRSVLDIVPVADALPGVRTTSGYAVWGHSQGAHAALFARELAESWLPGRELVGTVAIAPPSFIPQAVDAWTTRVRAKGLGLMALAGLAAAYPQARLDDLIAPEHLAGLIEVLESGCTDDVNRRFAEIDGATLLRVDPVTTEPWASLLHDQEPAQVVGHGPVVLVQGSIDGTLPPEMSAAVEAQMCGRGEAATRWLLPGVGHGEAISSAWDAMRTWTLDRFAGVEPVTTSCADLVDAPPAG